MIPIHVLSVVEWVVNDGNTCLYVTTISLSKLSKFSLGYLKYHYRKISYLNDSHLQHVEMKDKRDLVFPRGF
jgi:hypothetical protein